MPSANKKKILVAPLDWGLGHATRCIPIIKELMSQGCEVQVASSGDALILLKGEFPGLKFHELVSYRPVYSASLPLVFKILAQVPKFSNTIRKEHAQVALIVSQEKIDAIISDNRFGCRAKKVRSIFVTHQVNVRLRGHWRWMEFMANYLNHKYIKKFNECWVPDFENGITGSMARSASVSVKFVGQLSRLVEMPSETKYEVAAILSGPEPQRTLLENLLRKELSGAGIKYFLVKGDVRNLDGMKDHEASYLPSTQLNQLIASSDIIICRSGYSSIMDLCKLKKRAIFIPTPGQPEQEYLAEELEARGIAFYQHQHDFDFSQAIEKSKRYSGFAGFKHSPNLLQNAIANLIKAIE